MKQLTRSDQDRLRYSIRVTNPSDDSPSDTHIAFVMGNFARNDVLYGSRGYRRTLVEAGRVTDRVLHKAAELQLVAKCRCEFIDRDIDAVLEADGIEEGTIVVIELGGGGNGC
ncbi:MAG: hypothetical protein ND866_29235 [Pyrinomonadaceae bacterium]|nr:hypothetical protein [Pyrinomonadaceae bacterium]